MKRIIYGAGMYGVRLNRFFKNGGVRVDYFAQTAKPAEETVEGIPVISFDEMLDLRDDLMICMAISSKKASCEIVKNIYEKLKDATVCDYSDFIDNNPIVYKVVSRNGAKECNICGNRFDSFKPAGIKEDIFRRHHIIGGGYRDNCLCPYCDSWDRERWIYHVMKDILGVENLHGRVLHFAPEKPIKKMLAANVNVDYYTVDITPGKAMHVTDIRDIQYRDCTFDYVICNHVMEHITDEEKAVSEIKRVLKDGGKWIFSFPVCTDLDSTYEDENIIEPDERLRAYGQKDHVRLYGNDYMESFEKYNLKIKKYSPADFFNKEDIDRLGLIEDDILLIAEKT